MQYSFGKGAPRNNNESFFMKENLFAVYKNGFFFYNSFVNDKMSLKKSLIENRVVPENISYCFVFLVNTLLGLEMFSLTLFLPEKSICLAYYVVLKTM